MSVHLLLRCDGHRHLAAHARTESCPASWTDPGSATWPELRRAAADLGWVTTAQGDYCPTHARALSPRIIAEALRRAAEHRAAGRTDEARLLESVVDHARPAEVHGHRAGLSRPPCTLS